MNNEILIGDCAEVLKSFESESIDCIVTDPPYGYSFMGLEWDKTLPSLEALRECCRVLKAGAFGFFMCAPRMDVLWRMGQRLEEAGFRVDFSFIGWAQAQGFPKSQNMSKAIDRRFGAERERILNPLASKQTGQDAGKGLSGAKNPNLYLEPNPVTPEAQQFEGSFAGLQLKPCLEVIICVMKSLDKSCKTYVDQALQNGHGVTWLGNCKIPFENSDSIHDKNPHTHRENSREYTEIYGEYAPSDYIVPDGRFPANLLVSDNVLDRGIITKSGAQKTTYKSNGASIFGNSQYHSDFPSSSGDFSRYFSLDAWFDKKLQELPPEQQKTFPFLITPKPSKSEKNKYIENKHPTVKPLKLMSYLITLGSREGDVILDPFAGSGTTLEAARMLNRQFIGIDKDESNKPLMEARGQLNTVTLNAFEGA